MADNITDNSSSQDTSVQLGNMSVEIDQQIDILSKAEELVRKGLARLRSLQTRDAPITDEPCPKRNKEAPNVVGELKRYFIEEEKKLATASCGSDDPPCGSDDPPQRGTQFGKDMHFAIAKYISERTNEINPSASEIFGAASNELKETILRYIGCGALGDVNNNEFFVEYKINAKIDSGRQKLYIPDCIVYLTATKKFYVYDWKFRENMSSWNKGKKKDEDQMQEYMEVVKHWTGNERVSGFMVVFYAEKPSTDPEIFQVDRRKYDHVIVYESKSLNIKQKPLPRAPNVE